MIVAKALLTAWLAAGVVIYATKNGQPKEGTYKLSDAVISCSIIVGLLILGGFYK